MFDIEYVCVYCYMSGMATPQSEVQRTEMGFVF